MDLSNYDYHFIIKELAKEFEGKFTCLRENTETYITFSIPKKTEVQRIGKNGAKITKTVSYRLQCIDSARFMASSLPNLKEFINLNVNMNMTINNVKTVKLNTKIVSAVWWPVVANFNLNHRCNFKPHEN